MENAFPNGVPEIELWDTTTHTDNNFTCKTGVTLGLLRLHSPETRMDCFVQENTSENPEGQFAYYLGYKQRKNWRLVLSKNSGMESWTFGPKVASKGAAIGCKDLYFTTVDGYKVDQRELTQSDVTRCTIDFSDFVNQTLDEQSGTVTFHLYLRPNTATSISVKVVVMSGDEQVAESMEKDYSLRDEV